MTLHQVRLTCTQSGGQYYTLANYYDQGAFVNLAEPFTNRTCEQPQPWGQVDYGEWVYVPEPTVLHAECRKPAEGPVAYNLNVGTGRIEMSWEPANVVNVFSQKIDCQFRGWLVEYRLLDSPYLYPNRALIDWMPDHPELLLDWGGSSADTQQVQEGTYSVPVFTGPVNDGTGTLPDDFQGRKILTPRGRINVVMEKIYDGTSYQFRVRVVVPGRKQQFGGRPTASVVVSLVVSFHTFLPSFSPIPIWHISDCVSRAYLGFVSLSWERSCGEMCMRCAS